MYTLRICIGSNDGRVIAPTHMGDTERFLIYDVSADGEPVKVDERENTAIDMGHAAKEKMKAVLRILSDVDVMVAEKNSPNFRKIALQTRYQPIVVKGAHEVDSIAALIQERFSHVATMVDERRSGQRAEEIPTVVRAAS